MLLEGTNRQRKMEFVYIEDLVPEDHILIKIDNERISMKLKGMSPVQYRTHSQDS